MVSASTPSSETLRITHIINMDVAAPLTPLISTLHALLQLNLVTFLAPLPPPPPLPLPDLKSVPTAVTTTSCLNLSTVLASTWPGTHPPIAPTPMLALKQRTSSAANQPVLFGPSTAKPARISTLSETRTA